MKIVAISDTHGMHGDVKLPEGDLFIHAGDFCAYGEQQDLEDFCFWLKGLPYECKIIVAGNHDRIADENPELTKNEPVVFDLS